jgi:enamine deaminase RidA (YjgF/YER057c/UK114 family)
LLREAGASLSDIVKTTVYLTDRDYRTPVFSVLARWLKGVRPCQTGLIVNGLARPEMLMEIDVEAVIVAD